MVKKLLKFFAFSLFFVLALVAFTPKESFYFLLEQELQKFDVIISNENLQDSFFSLNIQNLEITTKGIDSVVVEDADVMLLLFYNSVSLENVKISSLIDAYAPSKVDTLHVRYTILNPFLVTAKGEGDFGQARAEFDILDREIKLFVTPSKLMLEKYKKSMRMLKIDENGEYVYAKTF